MRVLIGTPCAGSMVTTDYMLSLMDTVQRAQTHKGECARRIMSQIPNFDQNNPNHTQQLQVRLHQESYDIGIYTLGGESLVQRGRNHIAQICLTGPWDKLMFIDADAGWTWDQLKKILDSPHPVTAGVCPLKVYPISLNFLPFLEDEQYFKNAIRSVEGMRALAKGQGQSVLKVPFVGTAFFCIAKQVLMKMAETADHYIYPNPYTGSPEDHWDFFKVHSVSDTFLSEDWSFCDRARQLGYDVHIDTDVIITHTGNHKFVAA